MIITKRLDNLIPFPPPSLSFSSLPPPLPLRGCAKRGGGSGAVGYRGSGNSICFGSAHCGQRTKGGASHGSGAAPHPLAQFWVAPTSREDIVAPRSHAAERVVEPGARARSRVRTRARRRTARVRACVRARVRARVCVGVFVYLSSVARAWFHTVLVVGGRNGGVMRDVVFLQSCLRKLSCVLRVWVFVGKWFFAVLASMP